MSHMAKERLLERWRSSSLHTGCDGNRLTSLRSNTRACAARTHVKANHSCWPSLEFSFNADVWLLHFELEGLDVGDGCYACCDKTANWAFFYRRLLPQGGLVCSTLTECSRWSALTDAAEGTCCRNELLIPEGRAGEITLIWTLLLCLIFVMQSYSAVTAHRWMWIMVALLSASSRTPLIVLSGALQPSPGQQHKGQNNNLSVLTLRLDHGRIHNALISRFVYLAIMINI